MHFRSLPRRNGATCSVRPNSGCQGYAIVADRRLYAECRLLGRPGEDRGVGRLWSGAILETPGARCIPVAADRRRYDAANVGATRCISRRHGLVASARTRCDTTDRNVVRVATY